MRAQPGFDREAFWLLEGFASHGNGGSEYMGLRRILTGTEDDFPRHWLDRSRDSEAIADEQAQPGLSVLQVSNQEQCTQVSRLV